MKKKKTKKQDTKIRNKVSEGKQTNQTNYVRKKYIYKNKQNKQNVSGKNTFIKTNKMCQEKIHLQKQTKCVRKNTFITHTPGPSSWPGNKFQKLQIMYIFHLGEILQ